MCSEGHAVGNVLDLIEQLEHVMGFTGGVALETDLMGWSDCFSLLVCCVCSSLEHVMGFRK
jgi:hypothetical protein